MAETTADLSCERQSLKRALSVSLVLAGLLLCAGAASRTAPGQPMPKRPGRWMESIARPSRGWDYDGKRILGYVGYKLLLWDATTGKLLHKMRAHREHIFAVQFSPDGKHALSSSWMGPGPMVDYKSRDTRTLFWDLATGEFTTVFYDQVAGEFSPDGKCIVTFSLRPGKLDWFDATVWDAASGRQLAEAKLPDSSGPRNDSLHFSPDGRAIAFVKCGAFVLYNPSAAILYDSSNGREIGKVIERFGGGHRYTSSGALASLRKDKGVLTDIKSGQVIKSIPNSLKPGYAAWTHDGNRLAVFDAGKKIQICDIQSGKIITGAKCGPFPLGTAIVSADNSHLVVEWGGANNVEPGLGLYEMSTGKEIGRIKLAEWGHVIGFAPDSKTFLVGGSEFVIYDSRNGKAIRTLKLLDDVSFEHDWNR